ncbi:MAG: hypothetical protein C0503_05750 [Gemmatimonas sp.]|nr:hypothetical protein [Gemmatimonas sp.]
MRAVRQFALTIALALPAAACVEMTGPETVVVEERCAARRVYLPSTVDAALTGYDCLTDDETQSYVDYYELRVTETKWVDLYLESTEFDAYLMIFDEWDELITEDDDSGESSDAWVTVRLPPGRYYIAATSFTGGETGAYRLFVE